MRHALYGGWVVLAGAAVAGGPSAARAQAADLLAGRTVVARGQTDTTYAYPGRATENVPIPTGNAGTHGFYTFGEFRFLTQTWTLDRQVVAFRGIIDATGVQTGIPGTYLGSGRPALDTDSFGRRTYQPGFNVGIGYKTDDGTSVYLSYTSLMDHTYVANASGPAAPFFRSRPDLADTFLTAGVFNFPPDYSGPILEATADIDPLFPTANFYGIWNGATTMTISFTTRFVTGEIGVRTPLFQTELSRIYGLAGARFAWFFERFRWYTTNADINGEVLPSYTAFYTNTLSQRMYGPFLGCGHEAYMGKRFSVSLDLTGALLLNVVKERAKYKLGDATTQNKRTRNDYTVVPNGNADLNVWWYPIEGVQVRAGYTGQVYFNTKNMRNPIGFDYGAIDPVYDTQVFRLVHGFNVGLGLFF